MNNPFRPVARGLLAIAVLFSTLGAGAAELYREPFRPQFHFTPERHWMNDPNGMLFYDGEYHLFYQFNPFGDKWGHMSWGHAVSRDLVRWQHLPLALPEENGVMIFSGSAVVDWKNTSGFGREGKPPLVAIYTGHYTGKPLQNQHIAHSTDRGRTWTKYSGNPVLDLGEKDFRDPKVFWHEATRQWIMVVSWPVQRKVRLYASANLKNWTHLSDFGPAGSTEGIWECPDLFPLALEKGSAGASPKDERNPNQKWVLIVNVGSGAPAGGSGCQYFVGDFDGTRFTSEGKSTLWADYGRDFYAAVSWSDVPKSDGRRLWIGWMSNWEYAQDVPTSPWRSAMSVPRELTLRSTPEGLRLVQRPVRELRKLRGDHHRLRNATISETRSWLGPRKFDGRLLEIELEIESPVTAGQIGLRLRHGAGEETVVTCDASGGRIRLDRLKSGRSDFHPKFAATHEAPLRVSNRAIRLRLLLDASSLEVFANDGESVLTDLILPAAGTLILEMFASADASQSRIKTLEIWELKSAWRQ